MASEKTILTLLRSPRKESTFKILKIFESSLKLKNFKMDYVFLHKIAFCKGCLRCVFEGIKTCPNYEDIKDLISKIAEADVLFFATPVYCDAVSGIMKNFIDRFVYFMHRPWMFEKRSVLVATTQYSGGDETLDYLDKMVRRWGCFPVGRITVKMSLYEKNEEKVKKEIIKLGEKLVEGLSKNKKPKPGLYELTYFRIMRVMVDYTKNEVPLDYQHWKNEGWFDSDFYCDAKISLTKNLLAKSIEKRVQKAINKN